MVAFPPSRHTARLAAGADIALVVGRAPWWLPDAGSLRRKQQKLSFATALRDFLQNVSFHCYGKLVEPGRRFQERFFWIIFHMVAFVTLIIFLWNTHIYIDESELETTILDPLYPVRKVPFPAVSICSINRISNASALVYAEAFAKDPRKRGVEYFYKQIDLLHLNYPERNGDFDYEDHMELQKFLDIYDTEDFELFHNTKRLMENLTPKCKDILVYCRLAGKEINCCDEFEETMTPQGLCCTFNNNGKYAVERNNKMRLLGPELGLTLILNASKKDYYTPLFLEGFVASIYTFNNYPDALSGGVRESWIQSGIASFLSIKPKILETVNEARTIRPEKRNCYFEDEIPRIFGKQYSFSKCITRCRMSSILTLCKCIMFMMPIEYLDAPTDAAYCTLQHKECLQRYRMKWLNIIINHPTRDIVSREMVDGLFCPDCLPSCSETLYTTSLMSLPLGDHNLHIYPNHIYSNTSDIALAQIFFGQHNVLYMSRILKYSWFEAFSTTGSICGIIAGFSLLGICEFLFFLGQQLLKAYKDEALLDHNRKKTSHTPQRELIIVP